MILVFLAVIVSLVAADGSCVNQRSDDFCEAYRSFCYFPSSALAEQCAYTCGRLLGTCPDPTRGGRVITTPTILKSCDQPQDIPGRALDSFHEALTNFGFEAYRETVNAVGDEDNVFFSPTSIALALGMLTEGADGATQLELEQALTDGYRKLKASQFAELFHRLQSTVFEQENANYQLSTANKIYVDQSMSLKPGFASALGSCFQSAAARRNFRSAAEAARVEINQWVEDQTNEKIKDLIPPNGVDSSTLMVLVNAIYFKGEWLRQFKKNETQESPFKKYGQSHVQGTRMSMMYKTEPAIGYFGDEQLQAIQLPYKGRELSMLLLLPRQNTLEAMQRLESQLNAEFLLNLQRQWIGAKVSLMIPKFKLDREIPLTDILKQMGMRHMFSSQANFGQMSDAPVKVSAAFHKAFVAVDEEGTEAAAATAISMTRTSSRPQPKHEYFLADHPFMFAIMHDETNMPLFVGKFTGAA